MTYVLAIVDRAYSSWSLRGWLLFAPLRPAGDGARPRTSYTPELAALLAASPRRATVPALRIDGGRPPTARLGLARDRRDPGRALPRRRPSGPATRRRAALARSLAAEMHAGFRALRDACPMNLRRAYVGFEPPRAGARRPRPHRGALGARRAPLRRRRPVALRRLQRSPTPSSPRSRRAIATYGLPVGPEAAAYVAAHLADPAFLEWRAVGLADPVVQPHYELDLPERALARPGLA